MNCRLQTILLFVLIVGVFAKQPVPFCPIYPGTIHADHFSPLNGDVVTVDNFQVDNFSSFLLDFSSLNSATSVDFDLAGGIKFDNENFELSGNGAIVISSEVNSFTLEAPAGELRFQTEDLFLSTYGTDLVLESVRGDVIIDAFRGQLDLEASSVSFEGNFLEGGINLSSNGVMSFTSGIEGNGNLEFSGRNVLLSGDSGFVANSNSNMYFYALDKFDVDSDGPMNLDAISGVTINSLSGDMDVDAGSLVVQSPNFFYEATGGATLSSVLGQVELTGTSNVNLRSADQVKFTSREDGINVVADSELNFVAGDAINFSSSFSGSSTAQLTADIAETMDITTAQLTANDVSLDSQLDSVHVHADNSFSADITADLTVSAFHNGYISAQDSFSLTTRQTTLFDVIRNAEISAANMISVDGKNGNIEFTMDSDIYWVADQSAAFIGAGITLTVSDDADFEVHNDLNILVDDRLTFNFNRDGTLSSEFDFSMNSIGDATIAADFISMISGASTVFRASDIDVSTNQGDLTIDSPLYSTYRGLNAIYDISGDFSMSVGSLVSHSDGEYSVTSATDLELSSRLDSTFYFDNIMAVTSEDFEFLFARDMQIFAQDFIEFSWNTPTTDTTLDAGDDIHFQVGSMDASGIDLSIATTDFHVFARRNVLLESEGEFSVDVLNDFDLAAETDFIMNAGGLVTFTAFDDIDMVSEYELYGKFSFISNTGAVTVDAEDDIDMQGDRIEIQAGAFSGQALDFRLRNLDSSGFFDYTANAAFSTNSAFSLSTDNIFTVNSRTIEMNAMDSLMFSVGSDLSIRSQSNEDVIMNAENDISLDFDDIITVSSSTFETLAVESADFITGSTSIVANEEFIMSVFGESFFNAAEDLIWEGESSFSSSSADLISMIGGNLFTSAGTDLSFIEQGNGSEFTANQKITLDVGDMQSNVGEMISFTAITGKLDLDAVSSLSSTGGSQYVSSTTMYSATSFNAMNFESNDNGFISLEAAQSIVSFAASNFFLTGTSNSLTSSPSRFGTIRSAGENGDICVNSIAVGSTGFTGDSLQFTASGPNAAMTVDSIEESVFTSDVGSIGMNAFGFIESDPQFLFEEDVTYGIIYRTADGNTNAINVISEEADVTAFASQRFYISSNTSDLTATSGEEMDFRTFAENANINVFTGNGNMEINFDEGGTVTAGNALLPANFLVSATRDVTFDSTGAMEWSHLATSTADGNIGILWESLDMMSFTAREYFMEALDGGILNVETRNGLMSFTSLDDVVMLADTGAIDMIARGNALFDSAAGDIDISANGEGGSVFLSSGGEQLFSILATETKLFFDAEQGEVDFESSQGILATVAADHLLSGPCINVEGGSVAYNALTQVVFTAEDEIAFDADVEWTVDASNIDFSASEGFSAFAGGFGVSPGISVTSNGDVSLVSGNDVNMNATSIFVNSADSFSFLANSNVNVISSLDSLLDDSVTLTAQNAAGSVNAVEFSSVASLEQTSTSQQLDTLIGSSIDFLARRELLFEIQGIWTNDITGGNYVTTAGDIDVDISASYIISSVGDDITFSADSSLSISTKETWSLETNSLQYQTLGDSTSVYFDIGDGLSADILNSMSSTVQNGEIVVSAEDDITFTSVDSINLLSTTGEVRLFAEEEFTFDIATTFTSVSNNAYFSAGTSFTAVDIIDLSFSVAQFQSFAWDDITFESDSLSLVGGLAQPIRFQTGDDFEMTFETFSLNSELISFVGKDDSGGIDLDADDLVAAHTDIIFDSERDIIFDFIDFTMFTDNFMVNSFGHSGIQLAGDAASITSVTSSTFTANSGNIELQADELTFTSGQFIDIQTTSEFGDIVLGASTINLLGSDIIVSQHNPNDAQDGVRSGFGAIEFVSLNFAIPSGQSFAASSLRGNLEVSAVNTQDFVSTDTSVSAANRAEFFAKNELSISSDSINFGATGRTFTDIRASSNDISYSSVGPTSISLQNEGKFISSGTIDISSDAILTLDAEDSLVMTADRDIIQFFVSDQTVEASLITYSATGVDGDLSVTLDDFVGAVDDDLDFRAGDSFFANSESIVVGDNLFVESAGDVAFIGSNVILSSSFDLTFRVWNDGNIITNAGGDLTYSAQDGTLNVIARGMLGTIGGRYVLEDDFFNIVGGTGDEKERINRNTNGIEVTNIGGDLSILAADDVFIVSRKGSVEFRAVDAIRYTAAVEIWFFGIDQSYGGPLAPGLHKEVPIGFSTDYCAGNTQVNFSCAELSAILNDIVGAMVAYGLIFCDPVNAAGHCFT